MAVYDVDVKRCSPAGNWNNWRFITQLVRSAAHSVDCSVAVLFHLEKCTDRLLPVAAVGVDADQPYGSLSLLWPQTDGGRDLEPLVVNDAAHENAWPIPVDDSAQASAIRFAVFIPVLDRDESVVGALFLGDVEAHAGLSGAQLYVLKTHGVQLGAQMESSQPAMVCEPVRGASHAERLRLLESVVVNANDAVLITQAEPIDLPGPRVVYCNAAFTRDTGYTEADILGRSPRILQGDDTDRATLDRLRTALEEWRPIELELLNRRKDGSTFWVELSIVPVADEKGWFTHWVSVQRDVTERKRSGDIANQIRIAHAQKIALETQLAERERIEKTLEHAAFHDDLTQLRNRAFVMDCLASLLAGQGRRAGGNRGYLLFMDLDRFKPVNDCLGHRAGDLLLIEIARRLEHCVRDGDTLARVSGDEFVIVQVSAPDQNAAVALAERILARLASPFRITGHDVFVSASIGIVNIGFSYNTAEELLRDADMAMYAAKVKGPGRYSVFTESMRAQVLETLDLQRELRRALVDNQLTIEYQPIVDLRTQQIYGVEALARWEHPERGAVPPSVFIAAAEDIGIVDAIDNWLLTQACRQVVHWNRSRIDRPLRLSVNVSVRELRQYDFVERLQSVLAEAGLPADLLQLEITESLFLQDAQIVACLIEQIRMLGVHIALDDFGTDYSSLGYIDQYEIDAIKIGRHFIQRMLSSRRTRALVQMIIGLGDALALDIIAEGVETEAQRDAVVALGCPLAQGHLLGRPMSSAEFECFLTQPAARSAAAR